MSGTQRRGLTPLFSVIILALFVAGYAACLECDVDGCSDDTEHSEEVACACGCAYQSLPPVLDRPTYVVAVCGPAISILRTARDPEVSRDLFRPPRMSS